MPMPVSPRITAPGTQPPLGVASKTLPALSMTAMWVVSFDTPAESSPLDITCEASSPAVVEVPSAMLYFAIRPGLDLRVVRQRIAGDERP